MPPNGTPLAVRDLIGEAGSLEKAQKAFQLAEKLGIHTVNDLLKANFRSGTNGTAGVLARTADRIRVGEQGKEAD